jgi:hypothetical protein
MPLHSPLYVLIPIILGGGATFVGFLGGWFQWPIWLTGAVSAVLSGATILAIMAIASLTVCSPGIC